MPDELSSGLNLNTAVVAIAIAITVNVCKTLLHSEILLAEPGALIHTNINLIYSSAAVYLHA